MIDPKTFSRAVEQYRETRKCKHPSKKIIKAPGGWNCSLCCEPMPSDSQPTRGMPVFPTGGTK